MIIPNPIPEINKKNKFLKEQFSTVGTQIRGLLFTVFDVAWLPLL